MTDPTTAAALLYIKRAIDLQNESTAQLQHAYDTLIGMGGDGGKPERVLFCSPVTGVISDTPNPFGLDWFSATSYAEYYAASGSPAYHTGCDLNRPAYGDSGKPVYAASDGVVDFAGEVKNWQGHVITIKHVLEDGSLVWTRYAHVILLVGEDAIAKRGQQIGIIADYTPKGPAGDHLHFDVCLDDLGSRPGDWPGMDKVRLLAQYRDPVKWLKDRSK